MLPHQVLEVPKSEFQIYMVPTAGMKIVLLLDISN